VSSAQVDERFFSTLGIPVVSGRAITAQDTSSALPVAVISRSLAARWWPHDSAVGERFRESPDAPWKTVVGVVGDVRNGSFEQPAGPYAYYTPLAQEKAMWWFEQVVVRSDRPSAELAPELRALAGRLMPGAPIMETLSGEKAVSSADARVRFSAILVIVLAVLTLSLALVGMFAGSWQSVEERRREFGVRIALGATPAALIRMVLGRAAGLSIGGLAIGVPAALASTRLVSGLLFGVAPTDARVLGLAAIGLVATALIAASAPARRAATIDPLQSLKSQ
jgi:hypothetical protein